MKRVSKSLVAALMSLPVVIFATPVEAQTEWEFVTSADDDALYFIRNRRRFGNQVVSEFKTEDDPEGENGDENAWIVAANCKTGKIKNGSSWEVPEKDTVAEAWFESICSTSSEK